MVTQTTMGQPASGETPPIGPTAERRAAFWKRAFAACSESKAELERELRKLQMEMPDYKQCCELREKAERELERLRTGWIAADKIFLEYRLKESAPQSATAPSRRESIITTVGDDAILYLQLMNFEDGDRVEVSITPAMASTDESSKT